MGNKNNTSIDITFQELTSKIRENPGDTSLIIELAEHYENVKDFDLAIEQYKQILKMTERAINEVIGRNHKIENTDEERALNTADQILHSSFYEIETRINFCYYKKKNIL